MHRFVVLTVLGLALSGLIAGAANDVGNAAAARLCEHVKARKMLLVDRSGADVIWSDGALIEVARSFPGELDKLLSSPTATRDMQPMITQIMTRLADGAQDAKIVRAGGTDSFAILESADGNVKAHVASPYFAYLRARYPRATIRIKGVLDPIVFLVDGTFRASVMPMAMPKE